jgi:hypothetical protein
LYPDYLRHTNYGQAGFTGNPSAEGLPSKKGRGGFNEAAYARGAGNISREAADILVHRTDRNSIEQFHSFARTS